MNVFIAKDQNGNILKLDHVKTGNCYTVSIGKELLKGVDKSVPIYGTFLDGDNIYNTDITPCGIIVMGN